MALHFVKYDISTYEINIKKFEAKLKKFQNEFVDKFLNHHDLKKFMNQTFLFERKIYFSF